MKLLGAHLDIRGAHDFAHDCLHPPRPARSAVLFAVAVTGSLLVSPLPTALVATAACWLAALGALTAARAAPQQHRPIGADEGVWWPTTLRAVLTGLTLTLGALGASRALLQGSWETLLTSVVLVAAVVPWWLGQVEPTSAMQERRLDTRDDAQIRLWQSRRRVDAVTFAATVGLSGSLVTIALLVVIREVVAGGSASLAEQLSGGTGCGLTSATFAPVAATVSALAAAAATAATALSAHVRPTPRVGLWHLAAWCVLSAALGVASAGALAQWWNC